MNRFFFRTRPTVAVRIPRDLSQWDDQTAESIDQLLSHASPRSASHLGRVLGLVNRIEKLLLESPDGRRLGRQVFEAPRERLSVYGAEVQRHRQALVQWAETAKSRQRLQPA